MSVVDLGRRADLRAQVYTLMSSVFPKGALQSRPLPFDEEFAALLKDNPPSRTLAWLTDDGSVAAAVAWKSFELKQGLKLAALGLVVTAPSQRKKGYSRSLLLEVEARARAEGCVLICLWSDLVDHYSKLGYTLAGSEISWDLNTQSVIQNKPAVADKQLTVRPLLEEDIPSLLRLYDEDPLGPRRDPASFARQLRMPDSVALLAENASQSQVMAYAFAGKGRDLRNVNHELIGDPSAFPTLLDALREPLNTDQDFPPRLQYPYSHPQAVLLEEALGSGEQGAVCFAKVLNIAAFIDALNVEFKKQSMMTLQLHHLEDMNAWALRDKTQDIFLSPDPSHLLQIFCSPWPLESLEGLPGRTLKRLKDWQPYPLYFWGLDSV
jgi:GNAT superfamily N-acetyltransferase